MVLDLEVDPRKLQRVVAQARRRPKFCRGRNAEAVHPTSTIHLFCTPIFLPERHDSAQSSPQYQSVHSAYSAPIAILATDSLHPLTATPTASADSDLDEMVL